MKAKISEKEQKSLNMLDQYLKNSSNDRKQKESKRELFFDFVEDSISSSSLSRDEVLLNIKDFQK